MPLNRHQTTAAPLFSPLQCLLLDDDPDLGQAVADHLASAGHQVGWCHGLAAARAAPAPDLALLDRHLPDGDGLDLLRHWRATGQAWPVIVLTAHDQVRDRINSLQAGADDCLVKPFDQDALLADSRTEIESRLAGPGLADAASNSLEVIISRLRRQLPGPARLDLAQRPQHDVRPLPLAEAPAALQPWPATVNSLLDRVRGLVDHERAFAANTPRMRCARRWPQPSRRPSAWCGSAPIRPSSTPPPKRPRRCCASCTG